MARFAIVLSLAVVPSIAWGIGPGDVLGSGGLGFGGPAVEGYGGEGDVIARISCEKGTIFTALKVVRAYRDNEVFAFKHFEGRRLTISGRLVAVRRDIIIDPETQVVQFDGYVALVTPDGKPPIAEPPPGITPPAPGTAVPPVFGLEFRFPTEKLRANPELACRVAELFPSQFVTLTGVSQAAVRAPDNPYVGIIFADADLVR